jgi:hypothetical protein
VLGRGAWELELHGERARDKDGFSLAIKPALLLATGRDEIGLGAAKLRWAANLAGGYSTGKLDFHANLGYADNRNDRRARSSWARRMRSPAI